MLTICVVCDSESSAPWKGQVCYKQAIQHTQRNTRTQQPQPSSLPVRHYNLQVHQRYGVATGKRAIQCRGMITSCSHFICEAPDQVPASKPDCRFPQGQDLLLTTALALPMGTGLPATLQVPVKAQGASSGASS